MDTREILSKVDHTLLAPEATWAQIKEICDDGIRYGTASVCIPPAYVARAKEYVGEKLKICTVIGFPNGYNTTAVKFFETEDAVRNGADPKWDMIILDPPSFTRNKKSLNGALRGYKEIHLRAMQMLPVGGVLSSFSCSHHISSNLFRQTICEAAVAKARCCSSSEKLTPSSSAQAPRPIWLPSS